MEVAQLVDLPISLDDFSALESLVTSSDPFLIQPSTIIDKYKLSDYIQAATFQEVSLYALLDNNIFTRVSAFSKGSKLASDSETRKVEQLAAAVMVFFLLGDFWLEPNIALYEKAWRSSHDSAKLELESFRIADHIHPQHYTDLALGRIEHISFQAIEEAKKYAAITAGKNKNTVAEENFKRNLTYWKTSYLFLLKVTELWRTPIDDLSKAKKLIDWMRNDAFYSAVSSVFALLLLSPSSPKKMIKGIGSDNLQKLHSGLQNAAWDCVYVKHWINQARRSPTDTIWFLCSNDQALKQVANTLLHRKGEDLTSKLTSHMINTWGNDKGKRLYSYYNNHVQEINSTPSKRDEQVKYRMDNIDNMILDLETKLGLNKI
ncbi:MAG: hypothetical protein OEY66_05945 [Gammaproteobacteria bacterium]|nr:hypothetical protein [Gammaproteobacteria bacterium]